MYGVPHSVAAQQRQRRDRCGGDGGRLMASDMSVTRPCVLCVDDEPRILFALKALLRSQYEVLTANDGESALGIMRSRPINVLISDQRMPNMTGVEVLRQAKEIQPPAIRLLLTGYSDLNAIIEIGRAHV